MSEKTLPELAKKMKDLDITMLMTHTESGEIGGRPMSNNADVEYDGDSFYFTSEDTRMVQDIKRDPKVALSFQGSKGLLGKPGISIAVEGVAQLIRDKEQFKKHWTPDVERYFKDGVDTPGIVLIKVHASRIKYWDGEDEGEIVL